MAKTNKFEEMLEHLVNNDRSKAEELFHEIVVEKSRDIYENLLADDIEDEEVDEASKDEEVDEASKDDDKEVDEASKDDDKEEDRPRRFAMKVIRLEGKDRDARTRALRSLVEETHFALRVRRVAGVVLPRARPSRVTRRSSLPPLSTARRAPEPRRAARLLRDPAARRARAVQCHQRVYRRQARPASLHV